MIADVHVAMTTLDAVSLSALSMQANNAQEMCGLIDSPATLMSDQYCTEKLMLPYYSETKVSLHPCIETVSNNTDIHFAERGQSCVTGTTGIRCN